MEAVRRSGIPDILTSQLSQALPFEYWINSLGRIEERYCNCPNVRKSTSRSLMFRQSRCLPQPAVMVSGQADGAFASIGRCFHVQQPLCFPAVRPVRLPHRWRTRNNSRVPRRRRPSLLRRFSSAAQRGGAGEARELLYALHPHGRGAGRRVHPRHAHMAGEPGLGREAERLARRSDGHQSGGRALGG